jgi:hypothetical protein
MKKILFKSGHLGFGGVERVQAEYINYLHKTGYDVKTLFEFEVTADNQMIGVNSSVTNMRSLEDINRFKCAKERKNISF